MLSLFPLGRLGTRSAHMRARGLENFSLGFIIVSTRFSIA